MTALDNGELTLLVDFCRDIKNKNQGEISDYTELLFQEWSLLEVKRTDIADIFLNLTEALIEQRNATSRAIAAYGEEISRTKNPNFKKMRAELRRSRDREMSSKGNWSSREKSLASTFLTSPHTYSDWLFNQNFKHAPLRTVQNFRTIAHFANADQCKVYLKKIKEVGNSYAYANCEKIAKNSVFLGELVETINSNIREGKKQRNTTGTEPQESKRSKSLAHSKTRSGQFDPPSETPIGDSEQNFYTSGDLIHSSKKADTSVVPERSDRWFGFKKNRDLYALMEYTGSDVSLLDVKQHECSEEVFDRCVEVCDRICEITRSSQSKVARIVRAKRFYNLNKHEKIKPLFDKTYPYEKDGCSRFLKCQQNTNVPMLVWLIREKIRFEAQGSDEAISEFNRFMGMKN